MLYYTILCYNCRTCWTRSTTRSGARWFTRSASCTASSKSAGSSVPSAGAQSNAPGVFTRDAFRVQ